MNDTFYVDPIKEANKYNIDVVADSYEKPFLKSGESGAIVQDNDNITIYVNPDDSLQRQRFTIAHELGHFTNGHLDGSKKMLRDSTKSYSQNNYDFLEYEANKFAAELLMPKSKIDFLLNHKDIKSIEDMAKALIVSLPALSIRLKNLGYIS
jgi:Zn-dependent peptidase ImmA (M78 family)